MVSHLVCEWRCLFYIDNRESIQGPRSASKLADIASRTNFAVPIHCTVQQFSLSDGKTWEGVGRVVPIVAQSRWTHNENHRKSRIVKAQNCTIVWTRYVNSAEATLVLSHRLFLFRLTNESGLASPRRNTARI